MQKGGLLAAAEPVSIEPAAPTTMADGAEAEV